MENVSRLQYDKVGMMDAESDVSHTLKQTISQGLNDGGILRFRIPADAERFTDLNTILLSLNVSLVNADETEPNFEEAKVLLDPQGMHSLFSSVEIRFNDKVVSTMTAYPFTTALSRYLGCSYEIRLGSWDELDGTWECKELKSNLSGQELGLEQQAQIKHIKPNSRLIGRIYSDVLMSSRQYLPPGVTLGINLRRAADHFSLLGPNADDKYKIKIENASVYIKRLKLRPDVANKAISSLRQGHGMTFNRLECRMMTIPSGSSAFTWLNCLSNATLPNRLYVAFVSPSAYYGNITHIGSYFEAGNLKSMNLRLNGRDLLVEPLTVSFTKKVDKTLDIVPWGVVFIGVKYILIYYVYYVDT